MRYRYESFTFGSHICIKIYENIPGSVSLQKFKVFWLMKRLVANGPFEQLKIIEPIHSYIKRQHKIAS